MNGFALVAAIFAALAAAAQEPRGLCADRPGLATPPCTVDAGHLQVETGISDWTRELGSAERSDAVTVGETELRYGVTDAIEARVGWTPYGWVRTRDRIAGETDERSGVGDVTLGAKVNPVELGAASLALLPFATLPAGQRPIGAGDWGFGLAAPIAFELFEGAELELTPEVDAAVDEDGSGRHLAFGGPVGLDVDLTRQVSIAAELAAIRDRERHDTTALAGLSAAWRPRGDWQLDLGANIGLNHHSPDIEVYAGIAKWF
ncbi:MAG: transporter [Deltaproteobacteria bacterium]|nr:MAG: transporter [Deltaproteobacteria bacterium]